MTKPLTLAAIAALISIAACGGPPTPTAEENAAAAANAAEAARPKAEMPPAVKSTKTYRCDDNSVVSVDLMVGDMQANIHMKENAPAVMVKAPAAGEAMVTEGYSLKEDAGGITLASPGKKSQTCKP